MPATGPLLPLQVHPDPGVTEPLNVAVQEPSGVTHVVAVKGSGLAWQPATTSWISVTAIHPGLGLGRNDVITR